MLKKIALLALMMAALAVPVLASQAIQGQLKSDAGSAALLGPTGGVSCRFYSVAGADAGINNNTPTCVNLRCPRNFNTTTSNYACNTENTAPYNNDADNQVFYNLIDGETGAGACNHAAFYAFQGMVTNSLVLVNAGDPRTAGCPGATAVNCMDLADQVDARTTPLVNVNMGVSGPHEIISLGGMSPVPNPKVDMSATSGCAAGQAKVTWDEPETYASNMKNGVASPVKGVRLWKNAALCSACPSGDIVAASWAPIGFFPMGSGAAGTCQPITGDTWFALSVVAKGPSNVVSTEIETGIQGGAGFVGSNSQCVSTNPTAVRLTSVNARYAGKGSVTVKFTTGTEAGVTGFYVQRANSASGPWTRVSEMIPTQGDGTEYVSTEKVRAGIGRVVYYSVQVVMNDGSTMNSGATAVTLPATQKKLNPGD